MSSAAPVAYTLVVFGGDFSDVALATDFCAISKKFIRDGLAPTCLSGSDLSVTVNAYKTLRFGREDLGWQREDVYTRSEGATANQFYQLVPPRSFKRTIFDWLENEKAKAVGSDRLVLVFCAHGQEYSCNVVLETQGEPRPELLSKTELGNSLAGHAAGVRILIVDEACFSGSWTTLSPDLPGKQVLVEAASSIGGLSYNHRSASQMVRCSLFGVALLQELSVSPEGRIREHTTRIASEISHVQAGQPTSAPTFSAEPRSLWSFNISHFILTPSIAAAISNVASSQTRHERHLLSFQFARTFWRQLTRQPPPPPPVINSTDLRRHHIEQHLQSLVETGAGLSSEAGLMTACQFALADNAPSDLQEKVIHTIIWKERTMMAVTDIIDRLVGKALIVRPIDFETAMKLSIDASVLAEICEAMNRMPVFFKLLMPKPPCLHIFFNDPLQWLQKVLGYSSVTSPRTFGLQEALDCAAATLGEPDMAL